MSYMAHVALGEQRCRGRKTMEGLICQNKDFKEDPQTYREPMELFEDWSYIVIRE